ncbi:MAG: hypothetical protein AAFO95_17215, partial [Cyanobacteria bacterium J06600_6]
QFGQEDDLYRAIASPIRMALIAVYFWAGFHKLNTDFFDPQFSCSNSMFLGIVEALTSKIFGIPTFLVVLIVSLIFIKNVIPQRIINLIKSNKKLIFIIAGAALASLAIAGSALLYLDLTELIFPLFVLNTSIMVLLWELVGGIMLFVPRWQAIMFCLSIFMHLVLAPIGFVDFGALAFALWLTFIPHNYYGYLTQKINLPLLNIKLSSTTVYLAINITVGLLSGIYNLIYQEFNFKAIAGILFVISVLIVICPLIKQLLNHPQSWQGVAVAERQMPKFMYLFIVLLSLYAATSYLGLRTAGNFSMFSNLRTEGKTSNHLILNRNQLKIWNYQEDTVKVIAIDDDKAKVGHKYRPLKDHYLPLIEFKKLIYKWTKAGYTVPIDFEYQDRLYSTDNIVNDPVWQTPQRNWEMILMDFRIIQADNNEPNYCRW